jgi:hypothetical protein
VLESDQRRAHQRAIALIGLAQQLAAVGPGKAAPARTDSWASSPSATTAGVGSAPSSRQRLASSALSCRARALRVKKVDCCGDLPR